ncbi:hypothetical protein [Brevundimonas sp. Root1279]|uniref:hypothetical protein n=1 Tax=Brevundimonas sp. Root1279 TaxID=1736443 RepID=UPI0006FAEE1E|nr:hypothetical protein [Brevundimonas sp. Root1279]
MFRPTLVIAALAALAFPAIAQDPAAPTRSERVAFAEGAGSATVTGTITGYETVDYVIPGEAGERLTVNLQTNTSTAYFNVTGPDASEAMFVGSVTGNRFSEVLATGGDYTVRIYLMRNAARRSQKVDYTLTVAMRADTSAALTTPQ